MDERSKGASGGRRHDEAHHAVATILVNGEPRALPADRSLTALFAALSLRSEWVLVELNGEPLERARYGSTRLAPGDRLELATPMAGG